MLTLPILTFEQMSGSTHEFQAPGPASGPAAALTGAQAPGARAAAWHTIEELPPLSNFCRVPTQFELARTEQLEFTLTM